MSLSAFRNRFLGSVIILSVHVRFVLFLPICLYSTGGGVLIKWWSTSFSSSSLSSFCEVPLAFITFSAPLPLQEVNNQLAIFDTAALRAEKSSKFDKSVEHYLVGGLACSNTGKWHCLTFHYLIQNEAINFEIHTSKRTIGIWFKNLHIKSALILLDCYWLRIWSSSW